MKILSNPISKTSQTILTASSEDVFYPVSNLKQHHRAKAWRSSGNFEITDEILNVNSADYPITPGVYTTEEFRLELELVLQAIDGTFEVEYDEQDFTWTISCDTPFILDVTNGSELIGFFSVVTGTSVTASVPAHSNKEWVLFDMRTSEPIDSCILLWPIGDYKLSSDAVITVEANATNNWSTPAFSTTLTFDNKNEVALKFFTPQSYRYWRLVIEDGHNAYGYVELGQCLIGKASDEIIHPALGFKFQQIDTSDVVKNKTLQSFVTNNPKMKVLEFGLDDLSLSETEALLEIFNTSGVSIPVYVSLDETESLFTSGFCGVYGRIQQSLTLNHRFQSHFNSSLVITEEG